MAETKIVLNKANIFKMVCIALLFCIMLPFFLVTDLLPFYRFGMFAAPVSTQYQITRYFLATKDDKGEWQPIPHHDIGLSKGTYQVVCRRAIFTNTHKELLFNYSKTRFLANIRPLAFAYQDTSELQIVSKLYEE